MQSKAKNTGKMQQRRNTTDSSKCEEAYSDRHLYFRSVSQWRGEHCVNCASLRIRVADDAEVFRT
jgi:hypothetical protein